MLDLRLVEQDIHKASQAPQTLRVLPQRKRKHGREHLNRVRAK